MIKKFINSVFEVKKRNRLRFFTYSVYGGILGAFGLILLLLFFNLGSNGFDIQNSFIFGMRPTIIVTGSMEPVINVNSVVILEPVEFKDIEVGDIVRYTSYRGFSVLHRVQTKTSSYVTTKGDANAKADEFVVTADQITGRVKSIHNEFAKPITKIFGQFQYGDFKGSLARYGLGFLILILLVFIFIVVFIVVFEMITTVYFFKKYNKGLVDSSSYWLDKVKNREEENEIISRFIDGYNKAGLFGKIILAWKLRRYYNGLCNVEKEVLKTDDRLKTLNRSLEKLDKNKKE